MDKHQVTFQPDNVSIEVDHGTSLLKAANLAGIDLASTCGGKGTCGRCAVKVKEGKVQDDTKGKLLPRLRKSGQVLACMTHVAGDVVVETTADTRLREHRVLTGNKGLLVEKQVDLLAGNAFQPLVKKLLLTLEPPSVTENASDLTRLEGELRKITGHQHFRIDWPVIRNLAEHLRQSDWQVTAVLADYNDEPQVLQVLPGHDRIPPYGLAIDVGTTTVVVALVDLESGRVVDQAGTYNRQSRYGDDVISRMIHSTEENNGLRQLQEAVVSTINDLIATLLQRNNIHHTRVYLVVSAGNTTMTHLLMGSTPRYIRLEPYIPTFTRVPTSSAGELGLNVLPAAPVLNFPSVASYVGGDIVSGVLVSRVAESEEPVLFIDIGTNGEMVLGNREWMVTCACSAGPAFEGGGIACGMRAMDGAIERVEIDPGTHDVRLSVIGGGKPVGICGSGLIDCLAQLQTAGVIDRAGKFQHDLPTPRLRSVDGDMEFVLAWASESGVNKDITISESDVQNLLRAKGAIFAGIRSLLHMVSMEMPDISKVLIAGGFGNYLNIHDSVAIGLLPDLPPEKYEFIGNSSLKGAEAALLSKPAWLKVEELGRMMTYLELSVGTTFMDEFVSAMFLPHTDLSLFPSLLDQSSLKKASNL